MKAEYLLFYYDFLVFFHLITGLSIKIHIAPGIAPPNVRLQSMLHNHIRVIWDPLPGKFANGELRGYFVYIREYKNHYEWSDDGELGTSINVSHSETQVVLDDLDGGRKYQISVAAFTVDVGPRSEWQTIVVGKCEFLFSILFNKPRYKWMYHRQHIILILIFFAFNNNHFLLFSLFLTLMS